MKTKTIGIILTIVSTLFLIIDIGIGIVGHYKLEKDIFSYWNIADKSSTIEKKSEYVDKFVEALEKEQFQGQYNALILTTTDNSYDYNFIALKSFQDRLREIQNMDIKSFEYQTAIQQITEQEQGGAAPMLAVFRGLWWKENHIIVWNWIGGVQIIIFMILLIVGIAIWISEY
jgi:hypothetical protein